MSIAKRRKIYSGQYADQNPLLLLRISLGILVQNPVVLYPTLLFGLAQLFILEIIYFSVQYPLSIFFSPLIKAIWSEEYLHYPLNLVLLPKMFYYIQMIVYIFFGSFILGLSAKIISILNEHPRVNVRTAVRDTASRYVHIMVAYIISFFLYQFLAYNYVNILNYVVNSGFFGKTTFALNRMLLWTVPYAQFFVGILASSLVAYIIPIVIVDQEKVFGAFVKNLRILLRAFPLTIAIVGIPTILYLPILIMSNNIAIFMSVLGPESQILIIAMRIVVGMFIDLIILAATTTLYLFIRENK